MSKIRIGHAFTDSVSEQRLGKSHSGNGIFNSEFFVLAPAFFLLLFFGIIFVRLFYLQVLRKDYYAGLSDQNRTRTESVAAPRGIITDRFGRPLVANSPSFKIIEEGHGPDASKGGNRVKLLTQDQALKLISEGKPVKNDVLREYLYKEAFAHSVGYVGQISADEAILPAFSDYAISDFVGKAGLEKEYESTLHGKNGRKLYEVDSRGLKLRELGTDAPVAGKSLATTLDRDIGVSVAKAFANVQRGAAVVSDPRDGGILAIFSSPSFDPNLFTHPASYKAGGQYKKVENILLDGNGQPLLDRSISGAYPPGSTFKLITAIAALERGTIKPDTEIEDTGILKVGNFSFGNWYFLQYGRREGELNVVGAIKRSNDIFFYKTAEKTGVDNVSSWANEFGLGERLNIDLPQEAAGTVPTKKWKEKQMGEQWYLGDTYNYGIGQGFLLTTPLQVNMFTSVFANGGKLFQPHMLLGKNKVLKENFIKKENIDLVRKGMEQSCDTGGVAWPFFNFKVSAKGWSASGRKIDNKDFFLDSSGSAKMVRVKVACKTGTAEIGGKDTKPHAWITVFAPFNNPEIVVTVLVENGGEGSSVAGPIAKKILTDYFENKR